MAVWTGDNGGFGNGGFSAKHMRAFVSGQDGHLPCSRYHRKIPSLKGIATSISPDRTRLISILLSNSRLPGHLSPDLWHSMLIILILLIHATTRQQ